MIDLETLSTRPTAAILSIGAVQFDPYTGEFGQKFYTTVLTESCKDLGLHFDIETIKWWGNQGESAQKVLNECLDRRFSPRLNACLSDLSEFIRMNDLVYPWSNGADFDLPILCNAFSQCEMEVPWSFWNSRCYRTIKSLFRTEESKFEGTDHNALDDAIHQANHLHNIMGVSQ